MIVKFDGIDVNLTDRPKKIVCKNLEGNIYVTYTLNFPPYFTRTEIFYGSNSAVDAENYIKEIKSEEDKVKYEFL